MSSRLKKVLVITALVLLWTFVRASRVLLMGAGLIWLLHVALARVLRVRGIPTFGARYEAAAFEASKRKRLALRIVPPALLFLLAFLFWASALSQVQTPTSEVLVESGSPAEQAGMRNGDRIVAVGGTPAATFGEVSERVRALPAAAPVSLEVKRGDALHQLTVHRSGEGRIGVRPASTQATYTTSAALHQAFVLTVSVPWMLVRQMSSAAPPEKMMVEVPELQQAGGAGLVSAGMGATLSALWLPFLVLGLALFALGERAAPPATAGTLPQT
ncbi:PDZ domain-containing protein [Corallococcus sp. CA054B]|nr:PDZ domain-containing protein [Corallococcus sp. CA054B]